MLFGTDTDPYIISLGNTRMSNYENEIKIVGALKMFFLYSHNFSFSDRFET